MADLVPYQTQALARQQSEQIEQLLHQAERSRQFALVARGLDRQLRHGLRVGRVPLRVENGQRVLLFERRHGELGVRAEVVRRELGDALLADPLRECGARTAGACWRSWRDTSAPCGWPHGVLMDAAS